MAHVSSATAAAAAAAAAAAPARMRAVLLRAFGGAEALSLVHDAPTPRHGAHDVLVRVAAAGVNPLDCRVRALQLSARVARPGCRRSASCRVSF
jgi:hypothetical protein